MGTCLVGRVPELNELLTGESEWNPGVLFTGTDPAKAHCVPFDPAQFLSFSLPGRSMDLGGSMSTLRGATTES